MRTRSVGSPSGPPAAPAVALTIQLPAHPRIRPSVPSVRPTITPTTRQRSSAASAVPLADPQPPPVQLRIAWRNLQYSSRTLLCPADDLALLEVAEFFFDTLPHGEEVRAGARGGRERGERGRMAEG